MGQLIKYSFKPTSTHRFKQEGCLSLETVTIMQFSAAEYTSTHKAQFLHGTEAKQKIFLLTIK